MVGSLVLGTLGTGVGVSMKCVILWLSSMWDVSTLSLRGVCTLKTCCVWWISAGVVMLDC